jgi:co-chaperonin GroES (HSP10)
VTLVKIDWVPEAESIAGVLEPAGYRVLLRIPNLEAQMKKHANIIMPDGTRQAEEAAQLVGQVISLGPDAYADKAKFPTGPWCKRGDYVMFRMYAGTHFLMGDPPHQVHYRLINDDTVQAVVRGDPTEIERA